MKKNKATDYSSSVALFYASLLKKNLFNFSQDSTKTKFFSFVSARN